MFQPRSTVFSDARVNAIVDHLRAIERELADIGRKSGRRASANASVAREQIAEAVGPILDDLIDRFRRGRQAAAAGAVNLSDEAVRLGTRAGRDALGRITSQTRQRPMLMLAVAIGVGILIASAARRH
jgi:ElaB/YqjD/DUF883 family membrane-anchored ribosome-binding protein